MQQRRWTWLMGITIATCAALGWLLVGVRGPASGGPAQPNAGFVSGTVLGSSGPLAGARVRVRAATQFSRTDAQGHFTLDGLNEGELVEVTAWFDAYYIASVQVTPTVSGISLTLRPYHIDDHPGYQWVSPITGTSAGACGNCHPLIASQWLSNGHSTAVANPRFYSLYNGTDLSGTVTAGPGYVNDFPATVGVCAGCHAPGAAVDGYLTTNMNDVRHVITSGIHCDYCHKVGGVYVDPATGSVYANAPGVYSQRLLRPPSGDDIFFGPFDDVPDPDTYLPQMSDSAFCAPCHQFSFWGTPIYESYDEWQQSAYAAAGITCQDCHMPPTGESFFALPAVGGVSRDPDSIPSHLQLGARDKQFLQDAVTMTVASKLSTASLQLTVTITNSGAGHHLPTDFPGRQLILLATAVDDGGISLDQQAGPVIAQWGGGVAGQPGTIYAKVLQDVRSGQLPVVSYWKQTLIASDNRIPALGAATSTFAFLPPPSGPTTVTVELRLRRVFADVAITQQWDVPDLLITREAFAISP